MIELRFNVRPFLDDNRVCVRVDWNKKQYETVFFTRDYAEVKKWDKVQQKAKSGQVHYVLKNGRTYTRTSEEINRDIEMLTFKVEKAFYEYSIKGVIPSINQIRNSVSPGRGRTCKRLPTFRKSFDDLMDDFLKKGKLEKGWDFRAREKYTQALDHLQKAVPGIKPSTMSKDSMHKLCEWYISQNYKNLTMKKQITMLKAFLRFVNSQHGYRIPEDVLTFEVNYKEIQRTIVFLTYEEIMKLFRHDFWYDPKMAEARDLWCFMAFTSLRFSDLKQLCPYHIVEKKRIEMVTEKTDEHITIPLSKYALQIINRIGHPWRKCGTLFDVPSNNTLNNYIKDCAREVGLTREIVDNYYVGTERFESVSQLCDIISCHDARRSFVSNSLAMGIPPQSVMKCTGHTDFKSMQPYIGISDETLAMEMKKWNMRDDRILTHQLLDELQEKQLDKAKEALLKIKKEGEPEKEMYVPDSLFEKDDMETGGISDTHTVLDAVEKGLLTHIYFKQKRKGTKEYPSPYKVNQSYVPDKLEDDYVEGDSIVYFDRRTLKRRKSIIDKVY